MVKRSVYKNSPVLNIMNSEDDRFPFTFGVKKAKMILEHLDEIKQFVQDEDKKDKQDK